MIRPIIFLLIIVSLSSLLYLFFNDAGNVEIYFSDYYIQAPVAILCVIGLLIILLASGVIAILWWLKNLPKTLGKIRSEDNYKHLVNDAFDIICALESENKDLAIKLFQKQDFTLLKHPIAYFLAWRVSCVDKRCNESDTEKALLQMQQDSKTMIPALKELISNKIKSSEWEIALQYLDLVEKVSCKPSWFYHVKTTLSLALQKWDDAIEAHEKASKTMDGEEAKSLLSLIYYMKAKSYLAQNMPDAAIKILKKSLSLNAHDESIALLDQLKR